MVVLVVKGEKSPQLRDFPRQRGRQRDSNEVGNRGVPDRIFSERKLHLFRDQLEAVRRFFLSVVGVRCRFSRCAACLNVSRQFLPFPALLPAVPGEHTGIGEILSAGDALVHYLVDFPDFPLLRFVKGMVQGFLVELLGADRPAGVAVKERLNLPRLGVLRHKVPLVFL